MIPENYYFIDFFNVKVVGTGSYPPSCQGWQLNILRVAKISPRKNPKR